MGRKLEIEVGQSLTTFEAFTDEGDHQIFTPSAALMSSVVDPDIRADGITSGYNVITPDVTEDQIAYAAFKYYSGGVEYSVAAGTLAIARPAGDHAKVISVTGNSTGSVVAVAGSEAADTTFVETRGEDGAPPYIPVGSVEIGQVRVAASASAVFTASEIKQNGQYTERADYPVFDVNPIGLGMQATTTGTDNAYAKASSALDTRHTGDVTKGVYGQYYTPSFARLTRVENFTPAANSHSISSTETFDGPVGSPSTSLGQASFSIRLKDGVNDLVLTQQDKNVLFKLYPDENASSHHITQGYLGIAESYDSNTATATCTITPELPSVRFAA